MAAVTHVLFDFFGTLVGTLLPALFVLGGDGLGAIGPGGHFMLVILLGVAAVTLTNSVTDATRIVVLTDATPPVVFRPSTFDVTPGTELVLSLDVATALSFDEIEQLPPDANGEVVITNQLNGPILLNIRQRWASSFRLYAVNGSGGLDLIATGEAQ